MILSDSQEMLRDATREFAQNRIAPFSRDWEAARHIPRATLDEMGEMGLLGITVPSEYGGSALEYVSYVLALQEVAAADGAVSTLMSVHNAPVCAILAAHGTTDQKNRFLRPLARGEIIGAFALTEPQAGSDAASLRTVATRVAGGYSLSGTKQFITSGAIAGVTITFAVTDLSAGKRGVTAFLVPRASEGLTVARVESKLGQLASDTAQLVFTNVFVPDSLRIGGEGEGYRIALSNLEAGRIGIAAQCVGMARAALEQAIQYARERTAFGRPIVEHQAVAFRLAEMATALESSQQLVLHAASLKDAGRACLKEACMAKLAASEMVERVASDALQVLGGYGYVQDFPIEKIYRDARVCQIYEGTSDVQKIIIARQLVAA